MKTSVSMRWRPYWKSDAVAIAVRALIAKQPDWKGTATDLLTKLNAAPRTSFAKQRIGQRRPEECRGIAPCCARMRKLGYTLEFGKRESNAERNRFIQIVAPVEPRSGNRPNRPNRPNASAMGVLQRTVEMVHPTLRPKERPLLSPQNHRDGRCGRCGRSDARRERRRRRQSCGGRNMTARAIALLAAIRRHGGDIQMISSQRLKVVVPSCLLPEFVEQARAVKSELLTTLAGPTPGFGDHPCPPNPNEARIWQERLTARAFDWFNWRSQLGGNIATGLGRLGERMAQPLRPLAGRFGNVPDAKGRSVVWRQ